MHTSNQRSATNVLYYGHNLDILRRYLPDAAGDLVYLDPQVNSNRKYNGASSLATHRRMTREEVVGVRELDGMRIIGPADGAFVAGNRSRSRELVSALETGDRWSLGEVTAEPDESVATHFHPGEPEVFIILEGLLELHGAQGVARLGPGDVVFIPPDTEHGLRTPTGGRWLAVWPIRERVPGKRYAG